MKLIIVPAAFVGSALAAVANPWSCALTNCALQSSLAKAGPGFEDGLNFFAKQADGHDARAV
jgi:hypothetical protein